MSGILAWIIFLPLFFLLEKKSKLKAFFISYFIGIIFWLFTIYWLIHVTLLGLIVFVLYLALYFGIFGLIIKYYELGLRNYSLLFIPSVWVLLEYIRSHLLSGFCWALLGHSQYRNLPVIQIADITGAYGVSFLVMLVNVAVYLVISRKYSVISLKRRILIPVLCISLCLIYGYFKLHYSPLILHPSLFKISVIQGNIPQELKWVEEEKERILQKHIRLTQEIRHEHPDLVIWPETAVPAVLEDNLFLYMEVSNLARQINAPILTGAMRYINDYYYNSALLISEAGSIVQHYDKLHLVPFGEYIPLRKYLKFLEAIVPIGDFTAGKEYTVFEIRNPKSGIRKNFGVLICFEDIFPELARNFVKRGAQFLVNITNDAWFGKTSSPFQHLQSSVFRAVENRVWLVRSANTGVSGFISPQGKIISLVKDKSGENIFIEGHDTQEIIVRDEKNLTFYTRFGDVFVLFCLGRVLLAIFKKVPL